MQKSSHFAQQALYKIVSKCKTFFCTVFFLIPYFCLLFDIFVHDFVHLNPTQLNSGFWCSSAQPPTKSAKSSNQKQRTQKPAILPLVAAVCTPPNSNNDSHMHLHAVHGATYRDASFGSWSILEPPEDPQRKGFLEDPYESI